MWVIIPRGVRYRLTSFPSCFNTGSSLLILHSEVSCLTKWALFELAHHPDVQETLCAELHSALGGMEDSAYGQLVNSLPYLDAFTSEVLRTSFSSRARPSASPFLAPISPRSCGERTRISLTRNNGWIPIIMKEDVERDGRRDKGTNTC